MENRSVISIRIGRYRHLANDGEVDGLLTVFTNKSKNPTETQIQFLKKMIPIIQMTRKHYRQQAEYRSACFHGSANGAAEPPCVFEQT